jgi:hypothetical protein
MTVNDFEAMVARAGYRRYKSYAKRGKTQRLVFIRDAGGPILNVEAIDGAIKELHAAVIEALLDEEGLFQDDKDQGDPEGDAG